MASKLNPNIGCLTVIMILFLAPFMLGFGALIKMELDMTSTERAQRSEMGDIRRAAATSARHARNSRRAVDRASVEISHLKTKKAGDRYRYFFQMRNQGKRPFAQGVEIRLESPNGYYVRETFIAEEPLQPGRELLIYLDADEKDCSFIVSR